ncbi:MAG: ABC transporter ATP-binding protein [Lachnospiraceae bacterium]|nr:ABC transporter ATP-binding protein [Lachnospiraceae bacterium]
MNERNIIFKNVTKVIKGQIILNDINLEIPEQGIYGIVGRNGSGKTVLMKCLCGFMPVTKGEVWVGKKRIGYDTEFIEDTGFLIETPGFLSTESGFKNLIYLASIKNMIGKEQVRECIAQVGLDPADQKAVGKYSLGMRQRLGIAQAIMENPDIILLDEPMNGLDNRGVGEIRELLLDLKMKKKLILIISHNREDIDLLCDRVYEMDSGELHQVR